MITIQKKEPAEVKCIMCDKIFLTMHFNTICCSDACRELRKRELQNQKYKLGKIASTYKKKKKVKIECAVCENPFETSHHNKKTCSEECARVLASSTMKKHNGKKKKKVSSYKHLKPKVPLKFLVRGKIHYEGLTQ